MTSGLFRPQGSGSGAQGSPARAGRVRAADKGHISTLHNHKGKGASAAHRTRAAPTPAGKGAKAARMAEAAMAGEGLEAMVAIRVTETGAREEAAGPAMRLAPRAGTADARADSVEAGKAAIEGEMTDGAGVEAEGRPGASKRKKGKKAKSRNGMGAARL